MPADPSAIVAAARTWLGVPWRHQGRTRQGVDCAGLVVLVGRGLGPAIGENVSAGGCPCPRDARQHQDSFRSGCSNARGGGEP